jgi:NAD+ kinase
VTASAYPFPTVCGTSQSIDWFHAISRTLKWNERERQKSFVVIEEEQVASSSNGIPQSSESASHSTTATEHSKHQDEYEEEEAEQYDIDDVPSPAAAAAAAAAADGPDPTAPERPHPGHQATGAPEEASFRNRRREHNASSDISSQGASTLKNEPPSLIRNHPPLVPNPNLKAFAVWGLDAGGSSDGSLSDS